MSIHKLYRNRNTITKVTMNSKLDAKHHTLCSPTTKFHFQHIYDTVILNSDLRPQIWSIDLNPKMENTNGNISATDKNPIHSVFGSRVWFSGSVDRMAIASLTKSKMVAWPPYWKIQMVISSNGLSDSLHSVTKYRFRVGGMNDAILNRTKFNRYVVENNVHGVIILQSKVFLVRTCYFHNSHKQNKYC